MVRTRSSSTNSQFSHARDQTLTGAVALLDGLIRSLCQATLAWSLRVAHMPSAAASVASGSSAGRSSSSGGGVSSSSSLSGHDSGDEHAVSPSRVVLAHAGAASGGSASHLVQV